MDNALTLWMDISASSGEDSEKKMGVLSSAPSSFFSYPKKMRPSDFLLISGRNLQKRWTEGSSAASLNLGFRPDSYRNHSLGGVLKTKGF